MSKEAFGEVNAALASMLRPDEIAVCWVLAIDVVGPDGRRYLAHRTGGGHDGTSGPVAWQAVGMLEMAKDALTGQIRNVLAEDDE